MALSEEMEVIKSSLSLVTYHGDQHSDIIIQEPSPSASLRNATIIYATGDWISFDPDRSRCSQSKMSSLLVADQDHRHHCACDCVTIINEAGNLTIIYIDMKSGNASGFENQFKSTRQFVRYLIGLADEFKNKKFKIVKEKYLVLWGGKPAPHLSKTPTVPCKKPGEGTKPDLPHKHHLVNGGRVQLNRFI